MIARVYLYLIALALFPTTQAWAFPENVRHGYGNCTTCHVSPTGGGTLTQYGRELSGEIMSTWAREGEGNFLWGLVKSPEWLLGGGDLRLLQKYKNDPIEQSADFFVMQGDVEAAATYGRFTADATLGYNPNAGNVPSIDKIFSRRFFLIYKPTDQISLRGGRFFKSYGINTPDHIIYTKRGLGWDEGTETYNLEAAWIDDTKNFYLTAVLGRSDAPLLEKGVSATASFYFMDRYKVGASYFYGGTNHEARYIFGPFATLGFTPHFFLLTELDFQNQVFPPTTPPTPYTWGVVNYQRLDYEFIQGLHGYITQEYSRLNFGNSNTLQTRYGLGAQWFPRPHFEINMEWMKQQVIAQFPNFTDFAFVMLHWYP